MGATQDFPRRDLLNGLGSALVGFLVTMVVALYVGLGSLGSIGFLVLVVVGVVATVSTYLVITPPDMPAEARVPWANLITIVGSVFIGYIAMILTDSFLPVTLVDWLSTVASFVVGFVVAVVLYLIFRRV